MSLTPHQIRRMRLTEHQRQAASQRGISAAEVAALQTALRGSGLNEASTSRERRQAVARAEEAAFLMAMRQSVVRERAQRNTIRRDRRYVDRRVVRGAREGEEVPACETWPLAIWSCAQAGIVFSLLKDALLGPCRFGADELTYKCHTPFKGAPSVANKRGLEFMRSCCADQKCCDSEHAGFRAWEDRKAGLEDSRLGPHKVQGELCCDLFCESSQHLFFCDGYSVFFALFLCIVGMGLVSMAVAVKTRNERTAKLGLAAAVALLDVLYFIVAPGEGDWHIIGFWWGRYISLLVLSHAFLGLWTKFHPARPRPILPRRPRKPRPIRTLDGYSVADGDWTEAEVVGTCSVVGAQAAASEPIKWADEHELQLVPVEISRGGAAYADERADGIQTRVGVVTRVVGGDGERALFFGEPEPAPAEPALRTSLRAAAVEDSDVDDGDIDMDELD